MKDKVKIQINVLRKYGFLPVIQGDVDFKNVKSPKENEKETFASWCERVLGTDSSQVMLYGLYRPAGQTHVENLNDDGQLIQLFRSHAQNVIKKKNIQKNKAASDDDFDEFEEFDLSDGNHFWVGESEIGIEPWYVRLKKLKTPECLSCKDLLFFEHSNMCEFSDEYGDAARHIIVLNDVAKYAEELGFIFSGLEFENAQQALEELGRFAYDACEMEALKSALKGLTEGDRDYIEREHVKQIMTYVDGLFDAINTVASELENDLLNLSDAERFIGESMLATPVKSLKRCANFLLEF